MTPSSTGVSRLRAAEFFAGIGLVRMALEMAGFQVLFANDVDAGKRELYSANFGVDHFRLGDVREVHGADVPGVDLATASFPCTDLSLAGQRRGLAGEQSGMFWEFARILREMGIRRPRAVMLENVPSFATSRGGDDLCAAISGLNDLGYVCDLLLVDARRFVPQSRPRLFLIGAVAPVEACQPWNQSPLRPSWIGRFVSRHPGLNMQALPHAQPPAAAETELAGVVERLPSSDPRWWGEDRSAAFVASLSPLQRARLERLRQNSLRANSPRWATAYRRTRQGRAVWEIRADAISGCLRTSSGGSSKQALVEAEGDRMRLRWMTAREYARLQGAPEYTVPASVGERQALFGFGDAVCVPAVAWIAREILRPLLDDRRISRQERTHAAAG